MPQVPMNAGRQSRGQKSRPPVVDDVMHDAVPEKSEHHAGHQSARYVQ
jgi:hypothetical protein